jgi:hypothetical protein
VLRWLRRWRERDDQSLVKRARPLSDVDPSKNSPASLAKLKSAMRRAKTGSIA